MTEATTCEFYHKNNPKIITSSTEELEDGLPSYGDEDDKGEIFQDGFAEKMKKKQGICEMGQFKDPLVVVGSEDGLSGLSFFGNEDDKNGIFEDGFGEKVKEKKKKHSICETGRFKDPLVVIGSEDGLSGLSFFSDEDDKNGIFKDGFGEKMEKKQGICETGQFRDPLVVFGSEYGLPFSIDEDDKDGILENGFAEKVKEKKQRILETGRVRDPLVAFGSDIMLLILSCLDARSVALSLLVSPDWRAVASSDKIWSSKCEELWQGKAHLPRVAKENGLSKLAAYSLSVMDGKRKRVRKEDLCDHAWEFHFTEALSTHKNHACCSSHQIELVEPAAPEYWRMLDPYWNGTGPPLRRYFLPDGSQTAEPRDKIWGGHESCFSIVTSLLADGKMRRHYVRINRWPPMYVTRKEDWSWEISNNLCTYRSIPDADKEDGTGPFFLLYECSM